VSRYIVLVVAWRNGNALRLMNKVTLHRVRLVIRRVTVYGQVNHLSTKPAV